MTEQKLNKARELRDKIDEHDIFLHMVSRTTRDRTTRDVEIVIHEPGVFAATGVNVSYRFFVEAILPHIVQEYERLKKEFYEL